MSIPFSTVRFVPRDDQTWGVNFQRFIRRKNETVLWAPIPRAYSLTRVSLAGELRGLTGISRGLDVRLKPFFVGGGHDVRVSPTSRKTDAVHDIGLDARYGVTANAIAPAAPATPTSPGFVEPIAVALFSDYLIPFEVASMLLLVAMVGAIILARREL